MDAVQGGRSKWDSGEVRRGSRDGSRSGRGTGRPVNNSRAFESYLKTKQKESSGPSPAFAGSLPPGSLGHRKALGPGLEVRKHESGPSLSSLVLLPWEDHFSSLYLSSLIRKIGF